MASGQDDPSDPDEGKVLAPDELDIAEDEHVAEIDDGRYVVSPNEPISEPDPSPSTTTSSEASGSSRQPDREEPSERASGGSNIQETPAGPTQRPQLTERRVHEFLETEFDEADPRYGFDVTAKFDGPVQQRQMMSNDVVTIFESLVLWYAQHIDSNTPVEEVLGILLMESSVPIRYPTESLQRVVQSAGLGPDDTIADLMDAVGDDGLKF